MRSQMGTRALGSIPQELLGIDQNIESNTITLPFRTGTDKWSVLEVVSPADKGTWSEDDQLLAKQVTDQLSLALENALLLNETQQRNAELATLNEIIGSASQTLEIEGNS